MSFVLLPFQGQSNHFGWKEPIESMLEQTSTTKLETANPKAAKLPRGAAARIGLKEGSSVDLPDTSTHGTSIPASHIPKALSPGKPTDVQVTAATMVLLPVATRMPLKFGAETLTHVDCLRVQMTVQDSKGRTADGWGETPLSVQWAWPSTIGYDSRLASMIDFCRQLVEAWPESSASGHPLEIGYEFLRDRLPRLLAEHNAKNLQSCGSEPMPYLAAIICVSAFDIALHDAYGILHDVDIYQTYNRDFLSRDLASFLSPAKRAPAKGSSVVFQGQYPDDYLVANPPAQLAAWHLVGGLDPIDPSETNGQAPNDGYPVLLRDWITADGLKCLKIKLRGNDAAWDYDRLVRVGKIAVEMGVDSLSADFNCCVKEPVYVNEILDRLRAEHPAIDKILLYVEQPFPYELEDYPIDVHSIAERKPIFLDESAHDWQHIRLGHELGWSGVALKTCKTQTGAILSLCWAKAHDMPLMVQDLTNPMLAQIPHVRLAAHAGTIRGVETNAMQFYPAASMPEAKVHPGLYTRRNGEVDLSTLTGAGFGYRLAEIERELPKPDTISFVREA